MTPVVWSKKAYKKYKGLERQFQVRIGPVVSNLKDLPKKKEQCEYIVSVGKFDILINIKNRIEIISIEEIE